MSVKSAMTAIADKIRALRGISGTMGLDAMSTNLATIQTDISSAFTAVGNKGGTAPSSKVSGNLASAINSISSGVTVQRESGSFTTNSSGSATVSCGFQPDLVTFDAGSNSQSSAESYPGFPFQESGESSIEISHPAASSSYILSTTVCTRTSNGFTIKMTRLTSSFSQSNDTNRTCNYVAIKYT